jgi:hypothetical protein
MFTPSILRRCHWLLLLVCFGTAHAQFDTAAVVGTVRDASGGAVADAVILLHSVDRGTELKAESTHSGEYSFPSVQVGRYSITATVTGYEPLKTDAFEVVVGERHRVDLPLQVAGASVVVDVNGSSVALDTDSSERGTVIDRQEVEDLPLNGREYTDLALLAPGTQVSSLETGDVEQRRGSFNTNGMRASANNFLLDGLDNNSYQIGNQGFNNQAFTPSADSVQEFKIITSNYPAQYGRAGGAIVNVTSRAGENRLHASMWEYIRNTAFDAYGPLYGTGNKPGLVQNQFGGTVGGRIERDKSFYFLEYEGFRQITTTLKTTAVPTDDQRNGTFVAATSSTNPALIALPIKNPLTNDDYADGIVPTSAFTPFAAAVIAQIPHATSPGFTTNFGYNGRGQNTRDEASLRIDRSFGTRIQTFVRLAQQGGHIEVPSELPGLAGGESDGKPFLQTKRVTTGVTWQVSPRAVLDARFGWTQFKSGKYTTNYGLPSFYTQFDIPYPVDPRAKSTSLNTQTISSMTALGAQNTSNLRQDPTVFDPKITYSLQWGRHTLAAGYEYIAVNMYSASGRPIYGADTYNTPAFTLGTGGVLPGSTTQRSAALNFAAFAFGARSEYEFGNFASLNLRYRYHSGYLQDDWRVASKLTMNLGVRYEVSIPVYEKNNVLSNFDPTTNMLVLARPGSQFSRSLQHINWNNVSPRIGFAYQPASHFVVRSSYGISFMEFNRVANGSMVFNGPGLIDTDILQGTLPANGIGNSAGQFCPDDSQSLTCFRSTQQGYPVSMVSQAAFNPLNSESYYAPANSPTGYVQSYSFGLQYQFAKGALVDIAYVGEHGVHIMNLTDFNQAPPISPTASGSLASRRPIPNFTDISTGLDVGFLKYNSLQAKVQLKRGPIFVLNSFTYSQTRDLASSDSESAHGDSTIFNIYNPHYDAGVSGYNQPLNNTTAVTWNLPSLHTGNGLAKAAFNGWRLTTITSATSGFPINLSYSLATADKISNLSYVMRPNLLQGKAKDLLKPKSVWVRDPNGLDIRNVINQANLAIPAAAAPFGSLPRNALRFTPRFTSNLGVQKNFRLRESLRLQFRAEAFNWTNHTNWGAPASNISAVTFGQISTASASRQIQFAVRLDY